MIAKTDLTKLFETLLTIPGMNDRVKIDLKITLKSALLLSKIIERGLLGNNSENTTVNILDLVPAEMTQDLFDVPKEILQKAGLTEMNEKINGFILK